MDQQKKSTEYLNDIKEWQNKMYSPGEYLGGKLPPIIQHGNRKLIKYWVWLSVAVLAGILLVAWLH